MISGVPFLQSVESKLLRADEHLKHLQEEFTNLGEGDRFRMALQYNSDSTEMAVWIRFEPSPTILWGGIIGDLANNLRSALDHIIYAIAVGESKQHPPPDARRLQYPIADELDDWNKIKTKIKSLSLPVQTLLKQQQPYMQPPKVGFHPLSLLGAMNDRDKHRVINVGASLLQNAKIEFLGPNKPRGMQNVLALRAPVVDEAPLLIFRFKQPTRGLELNTRVSFRVVININDVWFPAFSTLEQISDVVRGNIEELKPYVG